MGSGYRITRSALLALYGIITIALSLSIKEFGIYFGVILMISTAISSVFLFLHFDKKIDKNIVLELAMDGFAGLIIFTYPEPTDRFFMLDFSFWIAVMGMLYLVKGLFNKSIIKYMWLYVLSGIMLLVLGFIILNYSTEYLGSVGYLIGFALTYYALLNIYLQKVDNNISL